MSGYKTLQDEFSERIGSEYTTDKFDYNDTEQRFEQYELKNFKNSFGEQEARYVVQTLIKLGKRKVRGTVSLTSRANMRYPVLVGRKLLKDRFIVNVAEEHLLI